MILTFGSLSAGCNPCLLRFLMKVIDLAYLNFAHIRLTSNVRMAIRPAAVNRK